MKRYLTTLLFFLFLLFAPGQVLFSATNFSTNARVTKSGELVSPDQTIRVGERFIYDVFWIGIPVGVGEVWVKEKTVLRGRKVFHVVGKVQANPFLSKFYPVKNEAHSWIDVHTLQSLQFQKKMDEGKTHADEKDEFYASRRKGRSESFETGRKKEFDVTTPVQDVLSVFYWVRRQALVPGQSMKVVLSCNQVDWTLDVNVLSRKRVELRGQGLVDVFIIEPKTQLKGERAKKGKALIYLKNDKFHTPVFIKFQTPFGSVEGVLKHPTPPKGVPPIET